MKNFILCLLVFTSANALLAQKGSVVTKTDVKLVNQKLLKLQSTAKKLQSTLSAAQALMKELHDQKDAIGEMNKQDMYWLQKLMEQKNQLEQMISNTIKAASEAESNIAKNLKAS